MERRRLIERIQEELGERKLIWVGTRGHDAIGLMDLAQFSEVYSIIAPLGSLSVTVDVALEQRSRRRVDLDTYTIDDDPSPEAAALRRSLLDSLTEPVAVVAYRSLALLSTLCFPRSSFVTYLGLFHELQATFEHKPWVESELKRAGLPVIPWKYYANEDHRRLSEELHSQGRLVLRANRSDGGAGLGVATSGEDGPQHRWHQADGFLAAAPLLEPNVPLNANACVFGDGTVSLHPASMQLIGIEGCTRRRFGYCGNDFGAIRELERSQLEELGRLIEAAGKWLWSRGYLGAFGVDALIHDGRVYVTEINARFQGSSALSARIDREIGRPDLYLCHIAAFLGLKVEVECDLPELVSRQLDLAQVVVHNTAPVPARLPEPPREVPEVELQIVPEPGVAVDPDAILCRAIFPRRVTRDGRALERRAAELLTGVSRPPAPHDRTEALEMTR